MKKIGIAACAAVVLGMAAAGTAAAPGDVTVVADHLNNPRGIEIGPDGSVYVAEAGKGGRLCLDDETCLGLTGSVTRVKNGVAARVATRLTSGAGRDGSFATGPDDIGIAPNGTVYAVIANAACQVIPRSVPAAIRKQLGRVVVAGKRGPRPVANVSSFDCRTNPDGKDSNSNPYSLIAEGKGHFVVADAGGNALFRVRNRKVSLLAVVPTNGTAQAVPTTVVKGPDGAYYVGELSFGAKLNRARVLRVVPGKKPTLYAAGFNQITGIAFGPDGSLYVTQLSSNPRSQKPSGALTRVAPDGTRTSLAAGKLFSPAGAAVDAQGNVYVSNWSVLPGRTPKRGPFKGANGQLLKISAS
jgi:sugar lactone lactonase YvrE